MVRLSYASVALAVGASSAEAAATSLNAAAKAAGLLYFGTAVDNGDLGDSQYKSILAQQFGQITPANSMKWGPTEPQQGVYSYGDGDTIANLASSDGELLRCHNLIWYQQTPNWLGSTSWTNATLIKAVTDHITSAVTHFKGKCYAWDVLNEALNEDGTLRSWTLPNIIGPAYIPIIFKAARAADPNVKLYYNDYNIESPGAKSTGAQNIVKLIQQYGAEIDAVGFESHFIAGSSPSQSQLQQNMAAFAALGVDVAITELDVRQNLPETSSGDQQQATDYVNTVAACLMSANCIGVTVWDFLDKYSWVPGTFSGQGAADLYGGSSGYSAKPAYSSVLSYLNAHTRSGSGTQPTTTAKTTSAGPTTTTTLVTKTSTTTPSATPTGATQAQYGQCGGQGWTGPTVCASPYTCKYSNPYYSQCL